VSRSSDRQASLALKCRTNRGSEVSVSASVIDPPKIVSPALLLSVYVSWRKPAERRVSKFGPDRRTKIPTSAKIVSESGRDLIVQTYGAETGRAEMCGSWSVTAKALIAAVIGGILFIVSGQARAEKMTFGQNAEPLKIPHDISITRVSIEIKGFEISGFADYCLAMWRTDSPTYAPLMGRGGYIEPLCFNVVRTKSAGDWRQHVDLSETPIFIPANTKVVCNSLGTVNKDIPAASMVGACTIDYERYSPGKPRYRFLRLPYYDQTFSASIPLIPSYFKAWDRDHPLRIEGAVVYLGNNYHYSSMAACLTRLRDGEIVEKHCFPKSDQQSPGWVPIGWTIKETERLGIDCWYPPEDQIPLIERLEAKYKAGTQQPSGDCAAYLVVEIPPDLELSPENAFRDYGNLPRDFVEQWCNKAARTFATETDHNPRLCLGAETCSYDTKLMNCRAAFEQRTFPEASCMKAGSCWDAKKEKVVSRIFRTFGWLSDARAWLTR
jgi:hypothetical protein